MKKFSFSHPNKISFVRSRNPSLSKNWIALQWKLYRGQNSFSWSQTRNHNLNNFETLRLFVATNITGIFEEMDGWFKLALPSFFFLNVSQQPWYTPLETATMSTRAKITMSRGLRGVIVEIGGTASGMPVNFQVKMQITHNSKQLVIDRLTNFNFFCLEGLFTIFFSFFFPKR